jgi:hypothetical protein
LGVEDAVLTPSSSAFLAAHPSSTTPSATRLQNGQPKDYSGARTVEAFLTFYRNAKTAAAAAPEKKDEL